MSIVRGVKYVSLKLRKLLLRKPENQKTKNFLVVKMCPNEESENVMTNASRNLKCELHIQRHISVPAGGGSSAALWLPSASMSHL